MDPKGLEADALPDGAALDAPGSCSGHIADTARSPSPSHPDVESTSTHRSPMSGRCNVGRFLPGQFHPMRVDFQTPSEKRRSRLVKPFPLVDTQATFQTAQIDPPQRVHLVNWLDGETLPYERG